MKALPVQRMPNSLNLYIDREYKFNLQAQTTSRVFDDLKAMTIDGFWHLSLIKQNRLLHRMMGDYRFVSLNHEVIGRQLKPKTSRKYK